MGGENSDASSPGPENLLSPGLRRLLGDRQQLADSNIAGTTARVLEESDPTLRAAAMGLILDSMNASNAAGIRMAFIDSTIKTGRRHDTEWFMMLRKLGAVLGDKALDIIQTPGSQANTAMEGWATAAPEAALDYLRLLKPEDKGFEGLRMSTLSGIALKNPARSFQLALEDPEAPLDAPALIQSAVQCSGMSGATEAFQKALDSAGPEVAQNPAFLRLFHALADDMFHQNWTSGQSEKMLAWLEEQKGAPFLSPDILNHAAMDVTLQGKLPQALDWMDRMAEGSAGSSPGREGVVRGLIQNPELLGKLDDHTFNRVIAQLPPGSQSRTLLANALASTSPDRARLLK